MSTFVKFDSDGFYTAMAIRHRKWRISSIYIPTKLITGFLTSNERMDHHDCNDHVTFYAYSDKLIHVRVTHAVVYPTGEITGRQVDLYLDREKFTKLIEAKQFAMLSDEPNDFPKIVFKSRHALHNAVADPLKRRALSKKLRDGFRWHGAKEIRLYDDGRYSFFFEEIMEDDKLGLVGGLICHDTMKKRGLLSYHTEYYSIHT